MAAAAMVLVALVVADLTTYSQLRRYLYTQVDQRLQAAHTGIEAQYYRERGLLTKPVEAFVAVRDAQDTSLGQSPAIEFGSNKQVSPKLPGHIAGFSNKLDPNEPVKYFTATANEPGGPLLRVRVSVLRDGGQLVIALPLSRETSTLHRLAGVELAVTALALLTVVALGWWLVRLSLRPLAQMEETAAAIAHGELGRRVPGDTATTEVGKLARTLNTMLERIQEAFAARDATERELRQSEERLRRFVADASHELRTPLTAVGAYAELFERGAGERPEDLARVMAGIRTETARMGELVEDLLLLARLDEGRPLERQPVELVGLASESIASARAVGPQWPVQLVATRAVEVTGDVARLRQVLDNLLSNVRSHTPPGTSSRVRVGSTGSHGIIEVADDGPGLPDEDLGRVFERFYRADASRSRHSGGAGLGLAIVAAIVAAHGGQVVASRTEGGGATFTVWLPAALVAPEESAVENHDVPAAPDLSPYLANESPAATRN